ncbi:MAG TPA: PEGA domain-containing protein [Polyangiaceae bacterium]|jgi:hypothetical protein|nr:PEGA domain-containing protein [Polyangiaceae bacterium]
MADSPKSGKSGVCPYTHEMRTERSRRALRRTASIRVRIVALGCMAVALAAMLLAGSRAFAQPVPLAPAATPSGDDAKEAKRHFTVGNDLYRDGRFQDAVVEFDASYRLGGRPSALRNGADCRRQLNEYADAYEAYQALFDRHRSQLSAADQTAVRKAIDELDALTGLLSMSANEGGAEIVVDDSVLARTPLATKLRLSVGRHKLVVRKAGFVSFELTGLELISKQTVTVDAKLVPEVVTGHLSVREQNGREVHVFVDDADRGAGPWEGDLAPGPHTVEAKGERFAAEKRSVDLGKAQRLDLVLTAVPTTGRLRIAATPNTATIEVDQRQVGAGTWEGDVVPGPHHVEVALGDVRAARDLVVERGAVIAQEIPLDVRVQAPPEYAGFYGRVDVLGVLLVTNEPQFAQSTSMISVGKTGPLGGLGAALHVGHSFGLLSAELTGGVYFANGGPDEFRPNDSNPMTGHVASEELDTLSGFVGPGIRITTSTRVARFTAGLALGTAIRDFDFRRIPDSAPYGAGFEKSAGYVDPGLLFDAGLLLGGTPGLKFAIGVVLLADFPAKDVVVGPDTSTALGDSFFTARGRGYVLASGPQVFLGPTLGVQFGH